MAVQVAILINPEQLAAAAAIVGVVPATPATVIASGFRVRLANTDTAAHAVTLYAVPNGATPAAFNECLAAESVAPNAHLDVDVPPLGAGGSWWGFADTANKVTISQLAGVLIS